MKKEECNDPMECLCVYGNTHTVHDTVMQEDTLISMSLDQQTSS